MTTQLTNKQLPHKPQIYVKRGSMVVVAYTCCNIMFSVFCLQIGCKYLLDRFVDEKWSTMPKSVTDFLSRQRKSNFFIFLMLMFHRYFNILSWVGCFMPLPGLHVECCSVKGIHVYLQFSSKHWWYLAEQCSLLKLRRGRLMNAMCVTST